MASQDVRLSKFEADFKQQQSEMTNKIDTVLKAITDRITRAFLSDTVKNLKLNINVTSLVLSTRSYPTGDPNAHLIPLIRSMLSKQPKQTLEDESKDLHLNLPVLEVLVHALMYNAILDKYMESLELSKNRYAFIQGEMPKRMEHLRLFALPCRLWDSKPFDTLADLGSYVNIILLYLFKKLNIRLLEETDHVFGLANGTKSYHVRIVKDVEVHIGRLKLLNDFYIIDMKKDPETPLLVGRGFLATANAVIDCRKAKIAEIARDVEINAFKDVLVFRRMDKPPKSGDGAWHSKIRIIDPDGEEFTKTFQSIPTSRKLSEKENQREIINLDHFHDT
ncbi:retrovirus-related pol polyprotein from transposon TNT 1-94 [Tanacetum coccineum]